MYSTIYHRYKERIESRSVLELITLATWLHRLSPHKMHFRLPRNLMELVVRGGFFLLIVNRRGSGISLQSGMKCAHTVGCVHCYTRVSGKFCDNDVFLTILIVI